MVLVVTGMSPACFDLIPENCVILSGDALEKIFGPAFSGRAILVMSSGKVDINTGNRLYQ